MEGCENIPPVPFKAKPLSPFISKLKMLLSDPKFKKAIRWSENGKALVISDPETFKKVVLDKSEEMFKTRNFTSFVRQLNLYGFRKVPSNGKGDPAKNMKFEHQHFRRDYSQFMYLVHRTCSTSKKRKLEMETGAELKKIKKYQPLKDMENEFSQDDSDSEETSESSSDTFGAASVYNPPGFVTPRKDTKKYQNKKLVPFYSEIGSEEEKLQWEYMYRKFQEEQMAVQLLFYLKYSAPCPTVFSDQR